MGHRFPFDREEDPAAQGKQNAAPSDGDNIVPLRSPKRLGMHEAVQLLHSFVDTIEQRLDELPANPDMLRTTVDRATLVKLAKAEINDRRRRVRSFGSAMFGEPAWDMLLILYVEADRARVTVGKLCSASGAAPTTALRWMDYLHSQHLISRTAHQTDRRASWVEITSKAVELMDSYLTETLASRT